MTRIRSSGIRSSGIRSSGIRSPGTRSPGTRSPGGGQTRRPNGNARIVFGLTVVAVGVLLTLDNLRLFDFHDLWQFWPVALILVGIAKLSSGQPGRGLFWLTLGTAFLLPVVFEELTWHDLWDWWPLFLVALGLQMVARSFFPNAGRRGRARPRQDSVAAAAAEAPDPDLQASAFLTGTQRRVSGVLRHGDLTAVMGGCDIDLTGAETAPAGAEIEIFAFWGGVTLRIPDDWEVDPQVNVLMGVVEDNTRQRRATGGKLTVRGMALMGGLELRN